MLQGILFDMDGTITLTERLHYQAFAEVLKKFGISYTFEEQVKKYAGAGSDKIFTSLFDENNIPLSAEQLAQCKEEKKNLYTKFVQENDIELVPGAKEFIQHTEDKKLKRIIATGNSNLDAVRFILKKVGLLEFFPQIISITEVPRGKPFPDVFIEAAKRIEVALNECVVLEDAINGVSAARDAGIRCIAFETTTKKEALFAAGANNVLKNYYELTDAILYGNE